ncbi:ataxin-7 isoform X1 [Phycodurus eques]|uniref:ataxin-7 isoform X1 n=1 Tax=Phycodurus eques TaxID=693459 RepID=UPI002ACEE7F9|nr:ataxin-7 isoform X1 [Phycodurus eques]XP_061544721.1 ataxin-7 isoform X1 [Phycodurus eques]
MSERAEDDVRGEQRRAARQQLKQQQPSQRGEGSTAMATVAERRSLPSPEIMVGQPWSSWVDAAKLHCNDGAELEESFKDLGKNREAMRLCREDMPLFGQYPAQDDFYLVMCSHCSQVVKPQAFQAHYERRHNSTIKSASTSPFHLMGRNRSSSSGLGLGLASGSLTGVTSGGIVSRTSTAGSNFSPSATSSSSNPKLVKPAKDKVSGIQRRPPFPPFRMLQPDKILTPAVKVEKMHLNVDSSAKLVQVPATPATTTSSSTSSSSTTVSSNTTTTTTITTSSSSALKPGLNCPSIPKPPLLAPGQIPNGKGHLSILLDKKQESSSSSASSRRHLNKKVTEREFNPDIHCGVVDVTARKTCTRSLTCKTHSLSQRRAVPGRRKRFDTLLAEHKNRTKERERELHQTHSQQLPPLRDPHPSLHLPTSCDVHPVAHGNGLTPDATKILPSNRPKFHSPGLPRLNNTHGAGTPADPAIANESPHHPQSTPDGFSRASSDEEENEEREENAEKLHCHYSGYHPRPVAYCNFGSRLFGRGCYAFDRRWDRMRCALSTMMDKHVNSQMWKKIPLALENSSSFAPPHRTSTNSPGSTPSPGFLSPPATMSQTPYSQSFEGKPVLSYGTTLNAHSSPQGGPEHPTYSTTQARQVSSSPQMPSAHLSSSSSPLAPSLASGRALKSRPSSSSTTKSLSFRPKELSTGSSTPIIPTSVGVGGNSSTNSFSSGKKRKNSSVLLSSHSSSEPANANYSPSSSFKKNCANVGSSGSTYHHSSLGSSSSFSSLSSSHSGVHSVGLNCGPSVRTNSLSLKAEPSAGSAGGSSGPPARGPPSGSPAESIKRMSVVMNSSDSTLSLGPFVHHQSSTDHHTSFSHHSSDRRLEGKKRKSSPACSSINSGTGGGGLGGGGGGPVPGRPKVSKSPAINNILGKHGRNNPGTPGLPNNSHLHQPKARP